MYNRYIPTGATYTRVVEEDAPPYEPGFTASEPPPSEPPPEVDTSFWSKLGGKPSWLDGILTSLKLDHLDTGDILLLLILLFIFLEGDDIELVITLGLLLLFGLSKKD